MLLPTAPCRKEHRPQCSLALAALWQRSPPGAQVSGAGDGHQRCQGTGGWQVCFGGGSATPADFSAPRGPGVRAAVAPWPTLPVSVSHPCVYDSHTVGLIPKRLCQLLCKALCPSCCSCTSSHGGSLCCPEQAEEGSICSLFKLFLKFLLDCFRQWNIFLASWATWGGLGVSPGHVEVCPRALCDTVHHGHRGMERGRVAQGPL